MCIKAMVGFLLTTLILSIGSMPTVVECGCSKDWLLNQFSGTVVSDLLGHTYILLLAYLVVFLFVCLQ